MRGAQKEITRLVAELVQSQPMGSIIIADDMGASFSKFCRMVAACVPSHILAEHALVVAQNGIIYGAETLRKNGIKGANKTINAYIQAALFSLSASPARYGKAGKGWNRSGDKLNKAFNRRSGNDLGSLRVVCALERDAKNRRIIRRSERARLFWQLEV